MIRSSKGLGSQYVANALRCNWFLNDAMRHEMRSYVTYSELGWSVLYIKYYMLHSTSRFQIDGCVYFHATWHVVCHSQCTHEQTMCYHVVGDSNSKLSVIIISPTSQGRRWNWTDFCSSIVSVAFPVSNQSDCQNFGNCFDPEHKDVFCNAHDVRGSSIILYIWP